MGEASEPDSATISLRVYSEPDGNVYLLYEAAEQRVIVESPINQNSLEAAKEQLINQTASALQADLEKLEGRNSEEDTPQQQANRMIKKPFSPATGPPFLIYVFGVWGCSHSSFLPSSVSYGS